MSHENQVNPFSSLQPSATLTSSLKINSTTLLQWYDQAQRILPWRVSPPNPYHVWLSEMMLQQTTVATVIPYFKRFIERWPTLDALAQASLEDVLHAWQGLGYYARARNLHRCAQLLQRDYGGVFPDSALELKKLPGIGSYIAAAISSIAFDKSEVVIDGNVIRVLARVIGEETPLPHLTKAILPTAQALTPQQRAGDYAQALMDLGATVCKPRQPLCFACPWQGGCKALQQGNPERYPLKLEKPLKPRLYAYAFVAFAEGCLLVRRRPTQGLLGGMWEVPTSAWQKESASFEEAVAQAPLLGNWQQTASVVKHTFTHFHFAVRVLTANYPKRPSTGDWHPFESLEQLALPTLMKKIIKQGKIEISENYS